MNTAPRPLSRLQKIVRTLLLEWLPADRVLTDHRPQWLHGMELDFHLPAYQCAIEVNGHQHRDWIPEIHPTLEEYLAQVRRDERKRQICEERGVKLWTVWGRHDGLKELSFTLSVVLDMALFVPDFIQHQWSKHIRHLTRECGGKVRFSVENGVPIPRNFASQRFLAARTQSDNWVPCTPAAGTSAAQVEGQAPGGRLPGLITLPSREAAPVAPR